MRHTFKCNDSMVISIPLGKLRGAQEGQLMPDDFYCIFRDTYKVFLSGGKPKPLGAAQAIAGVFILCLGLIHGTLIYMYMPSVVFIVTGMLSCAIGYSPNMCVFRLSFLLNIISILWSPVAVGLCSAAMTGVSVISVSSPADRVHISGEILGLIAFLVVLEMAMAVFITYHLSKAILRDHFNTLPTIMLKQEA